MPPLCCLLHPADYEVDFINAFTKLSEIGAKFEADAYLYPEKSLIIKF
jgi:hypothetical protein